MKQNYRKLGEIVKLVDERNKSLVSTEVLGISIDKEFMPSVANTIGTDLSNYKLLKKNRFACNPMHVGRDERLPVSLYNKEIPAIVSPAYFMFEIFDSKIVLPEYLMLNFKRADFDRNCWFRTDGSVRGGIAWDDLCELELPVPDLTEQQRIVNAYNTVDRRIRLLQKINGKLEETCFLNYSKLLNDEMDNLISGTIGDYAKVKSGYAFKSEWWTEEGFKVIKIGNIVNNTIDLDSCAKVAKNNIQKSKEFYVKTGDLLIAMTGATTGKVGIVPITNEIVSVNQRTGKFFLGDNPIERVPYLFAMMQSSRVIKVITPDGDAGSAQDNLSPDDIQNIEINYPTQDKINFFNKMNKPIICEILQNLNEIVQLKKVNNLLISRISGM